MVLQYSSSLLYFLLPSVVFDSLASSFLSLFLQTEISKVMRQGIDEMLRFENKKEEKKRVYTYKTAVGRCCTTAVAGHTCRKSDFYSLGLHSHAVG